MMFLEVLQVFLIFSLAGSITAYFTRVLPAVNVIKRVHDGVLPERVSPFKLGVIHILMSPIIGPAFLVSLLKGETLSDFVFAMFKAYGIDYDESK